MEELSKAHDCIEQEIFNYGLKLLLPWYSKRREFVKGTPKFWSIAVDKSELLGDYITYEDSEIFDHLEDFNIDWNPDDTKKYTISMKFSENKYIQECTLVKEFDPTNELSSAVEVPWKPGMDLTEDRDERDSSFFKWFGETKGAAFEVGQALSEDFYPHALNFYNYDGGKEEWSLSESDEDDKESPRGDDEQDGAVSDDRAESVDPPAKKPKY